MMFGASVRVERSDGRAPSLRLAQAAAEDFGVQRVTWNVDGRCDVAPLNRFLAIRLRRGAYGLDQGAGRTLYTAGQTFLVDPTRKVDAEVIGADLDSFTIDRLALESIASQIAPGRARLDFGRAEPLIPEFGAAWDSVLDDVRRTLGEPDSVAGNALLQAGLRYRLVATACAAFGLIADPAGERPASERSVRRAIAYVEDNLDRPISVGDIAEAVGLSVRGLQSAFQRVLSTTPHAYLRRARLHAARNDLLHPDDHTSVAGVAVRWGFHHLGRFSGWYRDEYGEYPRQTLRS